MELEFEIDQMAEETIRSLQNTCSKCGNIFIGKLCKRCGTSASTEKYYDPDFEEYEEKVQKENDEYFSNIKWEEVKGEETGL